MMQKKLKIGMMMTGHFPIPEPKGVIYAPMHIAKPLAEGLTKKGHSVYFFAPQGSKLKVTHIVSGGLKPLRGVSGKQDSPFLSDPLVGLKEKEKIAHLWDQYLVALMYQKAFEKKLDILHIHPIDRALPFGFAFQKIPVVYTLHDPLFPWRKTIFQMFASKNQYLVSLSQTQRKPGPQLHWIATIYNGIDLRLFPFSPAPQNYCLFLGRLLATKGVDLAILAAKKAKQKLIIAGTPNEGEFWEKKIKPYLGKNIIYAGNIPYEKTPRYYRNAKVCLMPIRWEEPFGLTFIESMACGTPVVAFDRGSAREIIKNGKTGFIVKTVDEMARAIQKIDMIRREDCRTWVEEHFTLEKMVDEYERVFYEIVSRREKM